MYQDPVVPRPQAGHHRPQGRLEGHRRGAGRVGRDASQRGHGATVFATENAGGFHCYSVLILD